LITGDELIDFAEAHGLIIPFKDVTDWADQINKNGGKCLCDPDRTCPCDESVIDCENEDPKQQICACFLISTTKYAEEFGLTPDMWAKKVATTSENTETNDAEVSSPSADEDYIAIDPGIQTDIDDMKSARDSLINDDLDGAYNTLANNANTNDCAVCVQYMIATAARMSFIAELRKCGEAPFDDQNYAVEKNRAISWANMMISFFVAVDRSLNGIETPEMTGEDTTTDNTIGDPPKQVGFHSPYQKCMSEKMYELDTGDMKRKAMFCVATKMCRTEPATLDQAKEFCRRTHPSWYQS
jgi:phage terminase small subunit